jgi:hypothetical protein
MQQKLKISPNIRSSNLMFDIKQVYIFQNIFKCFGITWHNFLAYFQMGKKSQFNLKHLA